MQPVEGNQAAESLRSVGLRVTAPRVAVLETLRTHPHSSAEAVRGAVQGSLGAVSAQAIYDVLNAFTEAGLARRIEPAGHPALFETRTGDNHHHLVCRECGGVEDVDCAAGKRPCLDALDERGFAIDEAEVTYWGLCPECRLISPASTGFDPQRSHRHNQQNTAGQEVPPIQQIEIQRDSRA